MASDFKSVYKALTKENAYNNLMSVKEKKEKYGIIG